MVTNPLSVRGPELSNYRKTPLAIVSLKDYFDERGPKWGVYHHKETGKGMRVQ
jgi:hypothetical protein